MKRKSPRFDFFSVGSLMLRHAAERDPHVSNKHFYILGSLLSGQTDEKFVSSGQNMIYQQVMLGRVKAIARVRERCRQNGIPNQFLGQMHEFPARSEDQPSVPIGATHGVRNEITGG